jgi:hypothetical protein
LHFRNCKCDQHYATLAYIRYHLRSELVSMRKKFGRKSWWAQGFSFHSPMQRGPVVIAPVHQVWCPVFHLRLSSQLELASQAVGPPTTHNTSSHRNRGKHVSNCSSPNRAYVDSLLSATAAATSYPIGTTATLVDRSNANSCLPPVPSLSVVSVHTFQLAMLKPKSCSNRVHAPPISK